MNLCALRASVRDKLLIPLTTNRQLSDRARYCLTINVIHALGVVLNFFQSKKEQRHSFAVVIILNKLLFNGLRLARLLLQSLGIVIAKRINRQSITVMNAAPTLMKVCIPIDLHNGEASIISSSFELAEDFLLYDCDLETFEIVGEQQRPKESDFTGHPLSRLLPGGAEVIITHSLRITSFVVFKRCGVKIFKAQSQMPCLNIGLFKSGKLQELSILDQIQGKTCGSSCSGCPKACGSQ